MILFIREPIIGNAAASTAGRAPPLCPCNFLFIAVVLRLLEDLISLLCRLILFSCLFDKGSWFFVNNLKTRVRARKRSEGAFFRITFLFLLLVDASFFKMYRCLFSNFACVTDKRLDIFPTNLLSLLARRVVQEQNSRQ